MPLTMNTSETRRNSWNWSVLEPSIQVQDLFDGVWAEENKRGGKYKEMT